MNPAPANFPATGVDLDPTGSACTDREFAVAMAIARFEGAVGSPGPRHHVLARAALTAADAIAPVPPSSSRHMDGMEASKDIRAFVEGVALRMTRQPSREIQLFNHERGDGGTVPFRHAGQLAGVGIVARDEANRSVVATWEMPKHRPGVSGDARD